MAATGDMVLGQKVQSYVESDKPMGQNLPQKVGRVLALPMTAMGLMMVITAFVIAIVRADLTVSLRSGFDAGDKAALETLGQLLPGFMFLGFAMLFGGISFAIARILGGISVRWWRDSRRGGSRLQDTSHAADGKDLFGRDDDGNDDPDFCLCRSRLRCLSGS